MLVVLISVVLTEFVIPAPIPSVKIVISRYQESVDHLTILQNYTDSYEIFNRGDSLNRTIWLNQRHVHSLTANVGRESFIYLNYIYNNYFDLADITIFSQATKSWGFTDYDFNLIIESFILGEISIPFENDGFAWLQPICCWILWDQSSRNTNLEQERIKELCPDCNIKNAYYNPSGSFAVTREAIQRRSRELYLKWARELGTENSPRLGFTFEATWSFVFKSNCSYTSVYNCNLDKSVVCPHPKAKRRRIEVPCMLLHRPHVRPKEIRLEEQIQLNRKMKSKSNS